MPLMEAMACGLPSIATDWGAHTEFVHEGIAYPLRLRGVVPADASRAVRQGLPLGRPRSRAPRAPLPTRLRAPRGGRRQGPPRRGRDGREVDVGPRGAPDRGAAGRDRMKRAATLYVFLTLLVWGLFAFDQGLFHDDAANLAWAQRAASTPGSGLLAPITAPTRRLVGVPYVLAWASPAPAAVLQLFLGVCWLLSGFAVFALARRLFPWSRALGARGRRARGHGDERPSHEHWHRPRILFFGPDVRRRPHGGAALPGNGPARWPSSRRRSS